jgi:hypothetical protein
MKALRLIAVAALAVAASSQSFATTYPLGTLTVPSLVIPVLSTVAAAPAGTVFSDDFTFNFVAPGGAATTGVLFDYTPLQDVTLTNVSLYTGANVLIQSTPITQSPFTFNFSSQPTGSYYLRVTGTKLQNDADYYTARIQLVPEPGTLALFGLGLAGAGIAARRGRKSVTVAG